MNDFQKRFKDMVSVLIVNEENLSETLIDSTIDQLRGLPMFASLTDEDIDCVRAEIKSEFSIKLDKGVLLLCN